MNNKCIGIIDDTTLFNDLSLLCQGRSMGMIPFGGSYHLIDFPLSCFRFAKITNVAILSHLTNRHLQEYIGFGHQWGLSKRKEGLKILSFYDLINFLLNTSEDYVILSNSYTVCMIDNQQLLSNHIQSKCNMTRVYYNNEPKDIYVLSKHLLINIILKQHKKISLIDMMKEINHTSVNEYKMENYLKDIKTINDYYDSNMDCFNQSAFKDLFLGHLPIMTRSIDLPTTMYHPSANVSNILASSGINCYGKVKNSILFQSVSIGINSSINHSIIMNDCKIGNNCVIEHAIIGENHIIAPSVEIKGKPNEIVYLPHHVSISNFNKLLVTHKS